MKQFFLFLLLSVTTFAVAQEDLSVSVIDFNTKPLANLEILYQNSSLHSSTKQISNLQGKVKGIPALDGYQVIFEGTAVYAAQKIGLN
jgi:hypothetical protein